MKKHLSKITAMQKQAIASLVMLFLVSGGANAVTAPTATNSIGAQAYNLVFTQGYASGLGYVIAGILLVVGFINIKQDWKQALAWAIGAAGVGGLPAILTALGASI